MANARKKNAAGEVTAEFGHEEAKGSGSRSARIPAGDYVAKIVAAKQDESNAGNQMIVWTMEVIEGKYKGKKLITRTTLTPKALFFLRNLLEALGKEVPEKTIKVKYAKYIGERVGISVEDGEYNNKPTSEINDFLDPDMVNGDDDEEDEDLEDEDEDAEDLDLDEMNRAELKEHIKALGLDVKVKKSMDEDEIRAAISDAEEADDDDDEEMEDLDLDEL